MRLGDLVRMLCDGKVEMASHGRPQQVLKWKEPLQFIDNGQHVLGQSRSSHGITGYP
jgi:hypothetical protein